MLDYSRPSVYPGFGDSLESPQWLLLAFCPKTLEGDRNLQMIILLLYESRLSGVDNHRWWGHSKPTS